jgi:hypothetical protein
MGSQSVQVRVPAERCWIGEKTPVDDGGFNPGIWLAGDLFPPLLYMNPGGRCTVSEVE